MALEDPLHYGWHRIKDWNDATFAAVKKKGEQEFEARLEKKEKPKWKSLDI
jgi:hypothetical protein